MKSGRRRIRSRRGMGRILRYAQNDIKRRARNDRNKTTKCKQNRKKSGLFIHYNWSKI